MHVFLIHTIYTVGSKKTKSDGSIRGSDTDSSVCN